MSDTEQTRKLVESIVMNIVTDQDAIHVDAEGTTFKIRVDPKDLGIVIGKHGQTARSLRVLLLGMGRKLGMRFTIDIVQQR
jgi:predicted RNA-binding protein YlqC (UPF0109 family)